MTQQWAWAYNEKYLSFSLRANWTFTDIAKLLDEDIRRPKDLDISCKLQKKGLVCTINCANEADFQQMKSELKKVLK